MVFITESLLATTSITQTHTDVISYLTHEELKNPARVGWMLRRVDSHWSVRVTSSHQMDVPVNRKYQREVTLCLFLFFPPPAFGFGNGPTFCDRLAVFGNWRTKSNKTLVSTTVVCPRKLIT